MRYVIQNKYQDEGWEVIHSTSDKKQALKFAKKKSKDGICYGMLRVIDTEKNKVLVTYPAGGK